MKNSLSTFKIGESTMRVQLAKITMAATLGLAITLTSCGVSKPVSPEEAKAAADLRAAFATGDSATIAAAREAYIATKGEAFRETIKARETAALEAKEAEEAKIEAARKAAIEAVSEARKLATPANAVKANGRTLEEKLTWLQSNAQSGGSYVIEVYGNEMLKVGFISYPGNLSYENRDNITIILRGGGIITRNEPGKIFTVGSGVTLVLDGNITLQGPSGVRTSDRARTGPVVEVSSNATLVMNDGSTITGAINNMGLLSQGGGVYVGHSGTFIMKGGTITRNTCFPVQNEAVMYATKGKANTLKKENCYGGGVYVSGRGTSTFLNKTTAYPGGTFTKVGGTITGVVSDPENGNVIRDFNGQNIVSNSGHAIYFSGDKSKSIDTTVGPEVSFHFGNGMFIDVQNEESTSPDVPVETQDEQ